MIVVEVVANGADINGAPATGAATVPFDVHTQMSAISPIIARMPNGTAIPTAIATADDLEVLDTHCPAMYSQR